MEARDAPHPRLLRVEVGLSPGGSSGWGGVCVGVLRLLGLQASAHLPALNPRDVQPLFRFVLPRHARALPAPVHRHTHTTHIQTHTNTRARTRLPPRSASYLPRRRSWSRTPGMQVTARAPERRLDQPALQPGTRQGVAVPEAGGLVLELGRWSLDPGASFCPAQLLSLRPLEAEAWSRGGMGEPGRAAECACEPVRPCLQRLGRERVALAPALPPSYPSAVRGRRASRIAGCSVRR